MLFVHVYFTSVQCLLVQSQSILYFLIMVKVTHDTDPKLPQLRVKCQLLIEKLDITLKTLLISNPAYYLLSNHSQLVTTLSH